MSITITEKAIEEIKLIIETEQRPPDTFFRVAVVGGGCSGFSYRIGFDRNIIEGDNVEEIEGIKVVIDSKSNLYLDGVKLDFHDGLMGRGFVFDNPNSSGTCGCGSSFSV